MPEVPRVHLASRNPAKVAEMQRILRVHLPDVVVLGLDDVPAYDEPVEDQPGFEGNALLKARTGLAATDLPTLADDSGLCVDALNGMPGVLSARWAGTPREERDRADERNNDLVLAQLAEVPDERRTAHFECAVALAHRDRGGEAREIVVTGRMPGRVARERRGSGGFGYDVIFVPDEYAASGRTSAELTPAEKDEISHRGRALREIAPLVAAALG